ncbi:hypothetical protein RFI_07405, partial [Reticulomyxa filosa]
MASLRALHLARKSIAKNAKRYMCQGKRKIHTIRLFIVKSQKKPLSSSARVSSSQPCMTLAIVTKRNFHASIKPRWVSPEDLTVLCFFLSLLQTTPRKTELKTECERRDLATNGGRTVLIERLKNYIVQKGYFFFFFMYFVLFDFSFFFWRVLPSGYENGITIDRSLVNEKRAVETALNRIPDKYFTVELKITTKKKKRCEKKKGGGGDSTILSICTSMSATKKKLHRNPRIQFHHENPSHIRFEGKYGEIFQLRSQVSQAVAQAAANETIYFLPHRVMLRLKRSVLSDIRREHDVKFNVMRHKHNGEDMMLLAVEGPVANRMRACDVLEEILSKVKNNSIEVTGIESFASTNKKILYIL